MGEAAAYQQLDCADPAYPPALRRAAESCGVHTLDTLGNLSLAASPLLAIFCSSRCPGGVILRMYDLARALREQAIPVIGGFHSPIERECLRLLLPGRAPLVICAARSLAQMRVPPEWRAPLADGRLLIISPIPGDVHRATVAQTVTRNRFAAAAATAVLVAHAAPGSKTEALCQPLLERRQPPLLVLDDPTNADLIARGAHPITADATAKWWASHTT